MVENATSKSLEVGADIDDETFYRSLLGKFIRLHGLWIYQADPYIEEYRTCLRNEEKRFDLSTAKVNKAPSVRSYDRFTIIVRQPRGHHAFDWVELTRILDPLGNERGYLSSTNPHEEASNPHKHGTQKKLFLQNFLPTEIDEQQVIAEFENLSDYEKERFQLKVR